MSKPSSHSRSRSVTPASHVGTPIPIPSPSRLVPPVLHSAPSLTNIRVYSNAPSVAATPVSGSPPPSFLGGESTSSSVSVMNVAAESMLVPDLDVDADADNATISAHMDAVVTDDEAKRTLREQLKRTLAHKLETSEATLRASKGKGKERAVDIELSVPVEPYPPRQYFVLTDAGKPVFISRQEDEDSDNFTSVIGLMQALISVFIDDGDKLRCINAGRTRITFLMRTPLYYAKTRFHLEYLHLQILSVVSAEQLRRMFQRRNNFDLRRLLSGAEPLLFSLLDRLEFDLAMSTSSLYCLKLEPGLRKAIAESLVPATKIKDILYVVMVAQGRVVTLVRPRKHSIHPSDLHILVNTVHSPSIVNASASASFLPICLPKFNPQAFVNAYVTFLRRNDGNQTEPLPSEVNEEGRSANSDQQSLAETVSDTSTGTSVAVPSTSKLAPKVEIGLVCVCGLADFEAVRGWCSTVSEKLERDGLMQAIVDAITAGRTEYCVGDLSIPGLRHFLYKSRPQVQVTMPIFEDPYDDTNEWRRLITLYQTLHDNIHAKSGQESTLKLQYLRTERESLMGWITQPFELYLAMSPLLPKSAIVNAANAIAKWVQKEEKRLFLRDAPVF
ncbi:hypothetical protein NM688_g1358 [Phlebia brevispora]|uniref:Uncharacterized protein n=1 Tax=Phlebia brevispora TaxID=194682 RepID=A0ACC1TBK8_9APHY|nr:hypothetical protein NM688_g1358 [Phlebia brevispora]